MAPSKSTNQHLSDKIDNNDKSIRKTMSKKELNEWGVDVKIPIPVKPKQTIYKIYG